MLDRCRRLRSRLSAQRKSESLSPETCEMTIYPPHYLTPNNDVNSMSDEHCISANLQIQATDSSSL